jgi:hypothetical protein
MFREDFLIRMIRQFAEALRRLMGQRDRGEYDAALRTSGELFDDLTTLPRELTDAMDTASFARLLGSAEKIRAMAMLFWEEGRIYAGKGDPIVAHARHCRAHELFLEARALDRAGGGAGSAATDDDSAILELSRVAPARDLAPRYRRAPNDDGSDGDDDDRVEDPGDEEALGAGGERDEIPVARVVKDAPAG